MRRLGGFLLCALIAVYGCDKSEPKASDEHAHENGEKVELTSAQSAIAGVKTEPVREETLPVTLEASGVVASTTQGRALVTPSVAGRIVQLHVKLGDSVRQGQLLGTLESSELAQSWSSAGEAKRNAESAAAQAKDADAQAELGRAKLEAVLQTLSRQKQFAAAGAFSQSALQQTQVELNDAQSELLSIQKEQAAHSEQLRRIEALFHDGIVSKIDLDNARLEHQQDEIRLTRAKARVDLAKQAEQRERGISQKGLLNNREIQAAEAEVRAAKLEVQRLTIASRSAHALAASAEKAVRNAEATYRAFAGAGAPQGGRVALIAPISGVVSKLEISRGQAVDRTQAIAEIEDLNAVWVTASVPEKDAAKVQKGQTVSLTVAARPNELFAGRIEVVGSRIDPKTRAIPVQCLITGARGRLKPEMFANVQVEYGKKRSVITTAFGALVSEGTKRFVFVKEGEGFSRKEVVTGQRQDDRIEITSGLKVGDAVAVDGAFVLNSQLKKDELKGHED